MICGRMYNPRTDTTLVDHTCDNPARWDIVPGDGIHRWACGIHINKVLSELIGRQMTDMTIKELHE